MQHKRDLSPKRVKTSKWQKKLQKHGWARVRNVLSPEEVIRYENEFWDWLKSYNGNIDRHDPKTWTTSNWPMGTHGLVQHFKFGHSKLAWQIRETPKILEAFAKIWHCSVDDLVVSFDGGKASRPTTRKSEGWEHMDQGYFTKDVNSSGFKCVQGYIALTNCNGGTQVYTDSHLLHEKFGKKFKITTNKHWYKLNDEEKKWYIDHGCKSETVILKAGDMGLWDSRTIHYAREPDDHPRLGVFVSYSPRSQLTKPAKKIEIFQNRRMTSHWAARPTMFPPYPRDYGDLQIRARFKDVEPIKDNELTYRMRRLIGFYK